jgi:hypothetical protein
MESDGRVLDIRDSTMVKSSEANRKGREFASQGTSQLSRGHVTPWGTQSDGSPTPASPIRPLTRQFNHLQNQEAPAPQGTYSVPEPSRAHNHMQNSQTDQGTDRLKMSSSRINDGNVVLGASQAGDYAGTTAVLQAADGDRVRLKVAPGCSKINDGNDIFGAPIRPDASIGRNSREEPFADRPRTGHIRNPWMGYTDASATRR